MNPTRRRSPKREAILAAIRSTHCHPSAEWVYEQVKPAYPDLSLGTVYRNLALFRAEGEIACIGTVNGQERFDRDTSPHAHFICERCGAVLDMDTTALPDGTYAELTARCGLRPRTHSLTFFGLCRDCAEAE